MGGEIENGSGILRMVPIVQSAHESRNGNSGLARNHGNLFGIVATESWKKAGKPIAEMPTWEVIKGNRVDLKREFRAYSSWRESFLDWEKIITTLSIYKKAHELMKDQATVTDGIAEMGKIYATDPSYARKLLELYNQVRSNKQT